MGYVAVKGGAEAIENSAEFLLHQRIKGSSRPLEIDQIKEQLYFCVDRVMGEASLYDPDLAALAIKQAAGDTFEAAFILRAYRATVPRTGYSIPQSTKKLRVIRRISAAFKDIPGGQVLGPTTDYTLRLLDFELLNDTVTRKRSLLKNIFRRADLPASALDPFPDSFPKVIDLLRKEQLLVERKKEKGVEDGGDIFDITRQSMNFPASRSANMQAMARGETGGLLLLAYSNMRGYGDIHPTIGELRVGYLPVIVKHPYREEACNIGEVKVTEAEVIARFTGDGGRPRFSMGYGLCFGHNEVKAISMAVLDRAMEAEEPKMPSEDQEFVLMSIDGIESMGFCTHYKLPHYVTFQSDLDRLRKAQEESL